MITYDSLGSHTVKELQQLCQYYDVPFTRYMRKDELIEAVLERFWVDEDDEYEEVEPKMSVRVKRIKESLDG